MVVDMDPGDKKGKKTKRQKIQKKVFKKRRRKKIKEKKSITAKDPRPPHGVFCT